MTEKEEEESCLVVSATDPGYVNFGFGGIKFFGLLEIVDGETGETKTIPNIQVVTGERWDLERGINTRPSEDWKKKDVVHLYPSSREKSKKMLDWTISIAEFISQNQWLFKPFRSMLDNTLQLPVAIVENQCDVHKRNDYQQNLMTQISNITAACICAIDCHNKEQGDDQPPPRLICKGMTKYGQRSDASRDRPERKEKSVDDTKELLSQIGATDLPTAEKARQFLQWLLYMEAQKEQIHDLCDCITMATQKAITMYEENIRIDIKTQRILLKRIPKQTTLKGKKKIIDRTEERKIKADIKKSRALLKSIPRTKTCPRKEPSFDDSPLDKQSKSKRKREEEEVNDEKPNKRTKKDLSGNDTQYPKLLEIVEID
jgi:hypothetical protein